MEMAPAAWPVTAWGVTVARATSASQVNPAHAGLAATSAATAAEAEKRTAGEDDAERSSGEAVRSLRHVARHISWLATGGRLMLAGSLTPSMALQTAWERSEESAGEARTRSRSVDGGGCAAAAVDGADWPRKVPAVTAKVSVPVMPFKAAPSRGDWEKRVKRAVTRPGRVCVSAGAIATDTDMPPETMSSGRLTDATTDAPPAAAATEPVTVMGSEATRPMLRRTSATFAPEATGRTPVPPTAERKTTVREPVLPAVALGVT